MIRVTLLLLLSLIGAFAQDDDRPIVDDRGKAREKAARNDLPTLWIAGDSTVKAPSPMVGWGQEIGALFQRDRINVVNHAVGGRSSRTFYSEGRWDQIVKDVKKGDFVLVQFGHNDVGPIDARNKFRGSLKGIGDETEEVEKPDGTTETVHTFGWYLRHFASTAREKGATVVLCSPVPHNDWDDRGRFKDDWDGWRDWIRTCARREKALYIDLADRVGKKYRKLGADGVKPLFADQRTHTTRKGARLNAETVVEALEELPGQPFRKYLVPASKR